MGKCKHNWSYAAGRCRCTKCGMYLQPNGKITDTPTGRKKKGYNKKCTILKKK